MNLGLHTEMAGTTAGSAVVAALWGLPTALICWTISFLVWRIASKYITGKWFV